MEISTSMITIAEAVQPPIRGYEARPGGAGKYPAIMLIHENRGLVEHIKDVTRRFAKEGYVAVAVDLFDGHLPTEQEEIQRLRGGVTDEKLAKYMQAAKDYLSKRDYVRADRITVIGYCMGGGFSLQTACMVRGLAACIVYYGRIPNTGDVARVECPVLGIFGGDDERVTSWVEAELKPTMSRLGKNFMMKVYPGAGHAFFNDTGAKYHPEAAKDAWRLTLDFFGAHLQG